MILDKFVDCTAVDSSARDRAMGFALQAAGFANLSSPQALLQCAELFRIFLVGKPRGPQKRHRKNDKRRRGP